MSPAATSSPRIVKAGAGELSDLLGIGARHLVDAADTEQRFSVVEHPMPPRALAAPVHRHVREDEHSFVIEGRMGALLGGETVFAEAGDFVFKPRNQWHTFWNAGDTPCRVLEIISPGGFEDYFRGMHRIATAGGDLDMAAIAELSERFGLEFDFEATGPVVAEHGLVFGPADGV